MEEEINEKDFEADTLQNISDNSLCILCTSVIPNQVLSENEEQEDDNSFIDKLIKFEEELSEIVSKSSNSCKIPRKKKMYKVCPNCKILMTSAFKSKSQLDEMESHVRYLQKAILRALKVVDRHLKTFNRDLRRIGEVIRLSGNDNKIIKKITQRNPKNTSRNLTANVLEFRECILNAAANLDQFRKDKQSKNVNTIRSHHHREPDQIPPPEVVLMEDDDIITASQMETDNVPDDHDDNWLPDHDDDDDNINDNNESDHDQQQRPSSSKTKAKKNSKTSSFTPTQPMNELDLLKESPRPILGKRYFSILEPVTSSMSPFKAAIVRRTFNKSKRKPRQTEPEGPLSSHYVTYNADTDILSVDNQIEIRFNENDQCLECTLCPYSCKDTQESETNRNNAEKKMLYHVLGKHLNIFKCDQCNKQMTSYCQYRKHREIHLKMGSGDEPICEICGKVLKSVESFEDHKWVHMTKEEKEEARRHGKKDPADKFKKMPRRYLCQECGKGFRRPCELKQHMKTGIHGGKKGDGEGEPVLCGGCGVMFTQMGGLAKHLKMNRCKGQNKKGVIKVDTSSVDNNYV